MAFQAVDSKRSYYVRIANSEVSVKKNEVVIDSPPHFLGMAQRAATTVY